MVEGILHIPWQCSLNFSNFLVKEISYSFFEGFFIYFIKIIRNLQYISVDLEMFLFKAFFLFLVMFIYMVPAYRSLNKTGKVATPYITALDKIHHQILIACRLILKVLMSSFYLIKCQ